MLAGELALSLCARTTRVTKLSALTSWIISRCSALSVLGHAAIMDGKLDVEHQTWVLAASRQQLNDCHQPSKFLIWTSRWLLVPLHVCP